MIRREVLGMDEPSERGIRVVEVHEWMEEETRCLVLREHTLERCSARMCGEEIGPNDPEDGPAFGTVTVGPCDPPEDV